MTTPVSLFPTAIAVVPVGGQPVVAAYGPLLGGFLQNPASATDQGLLLAEPLYVDVEQAAGTVEGPTTVEVQPGSIFTIPAGLTTNVSVNAKSSGHKFAGIVVQPAVPFPPIPQEGSFPPSGPTTLTALVPSYLYEEYADDDDLQAFVASWNALAQGYVDWFAQTYLADYTSSAIFGPLLDWIAEGIYGMTRPTLSSGRNRDVGPLNTYGGNELEPNRVKRIGPSNVIATSDDVFKRIMTWNFYKGDGNVFNVRWVKRRVVRFLIGTDGIAPNIDETYPVSVTFGGGIIVIRITVGTRSIVGGALPNRVGCNTLTPNALKTLFTPSSTPHFANETVLKEAMESGFLQMPFQYQTVVVV